MRDAQAQRAKERQDRAAEKAARVEKEAAEREAAEEKRRRARADLHANLAANKAEELARHTEQVWHQAQAVANRCRAEVEKQQHMVALLREPADESDGRHGGGSTAHRGVMTPPSPAATSPTLAALVKRLQVADARAASAKKAFQEAAHDAKALAQTRKLWLGTE